MKTTLLFSAALFFATASFAQTNVKSNAEIKGKSELHTNRVTNVSASSETNVKADAFGKAHKKSSDATIHEHRAMVKEKQSVSARANNKGQMISGIASDKSDIKVQGNEKGKWISGIASEGKSESGLAHSNGSDHANATVENNARVKTKATKIKHSGKKIKANSANKIHAGTTSAHAVKIKPVSVKTKTAAGVGIEIK